MIRIIDRIGFLVHHVEMFNHYREVWRHLPPGSVDIVVPASLEELPSIIAGCERQGLPWRKTRDMIENKERYATLISSFPMQFLSEDGVYERVRPIAEYSIRFMYATGKAGWNFQKWNTEYDAILCFGPYQAERLAFCERTHKIQMGYPRFDRFFNEPLDRAVRLRELGLDPSRRTVVWLPTWHSLSSIDAFTPAVAALQDRYNVIVKPHPLTISKEPARMQQLNAIDCCIREHIDNVILFQLADYLLCDYGGSAFGGIYTDRNVVLLDLPDAEKDELLGQDSADFLLRKDLPHLSAGDAGQLGALFDDEALWAQQRTIRAALSRYYFAPFHGRAAQVAAQAILHAHKRDCVST